LGELRPEEYKAFYRCSIWLSEQLEEEIAAGNWFVAETTPDYIFQLESDFVEGPKLLPATSGSSQTTPSSSSSPPTTTTQVTSDLTTTTTTTTTQSSSSSLPTTTAQVTSDPTTTTITTTQSSSSSSSSSSVVSVSPSQTESTHATKSNKKEESEKKGTKMTYRIKFWKQTLEIMGGEYAHIAQFPELDSIPPELNLAHISEA
jgi:hypothetical protein